MKLQEKGMTLTEILIVVSILVILIILITVAYRAQILKGRDAKRKGDVHLIQVAVEEYEKDYNCYPPPALVVCNPGDGLRPYLSKIPCDPSSKTSYFYEPEDDACPGWYRIFVDLENTQDSDYLAGIGPEGAYSFYLSSPNAPIPSPAPSPTSSPTPAPSPPADEFFGCKSGFCVSISWDPTRPGPECDPNYQNSSCYGQCQIPANECVPWK